MTVNVMEQVAADCQAAGAIEGHEPDLWSPDLRVIGYRVGINGLAQDRDRATWNAALVLRTLGPSAAADVLAMYDRLLTRCYGEVASWLT